MWFFRRPFVNASLKGGMFCNALMVLPCLMALRLNTFNASTTKSTSISWWVIACACMSHACRITCTHSFTCTFVTVQQASVSELAQTIFKYAIVLYEYLLVSIGTHRTCSWAPLWRSQWKACGSYRLLLWGSSPWFTSSVTANGCCSWAGMQWHTSACVYVQACVHMYCTKYLSLIYYACMLTSPYSQIYCHCVWLYLMHTGSPACTEWVLCIYKQLEEFMMLALSFHYIGNELPQSARWQARRLLWWWTISQFRTLPSRPMRTSDPIVLWWGGSVQPHW